MLAATIQLIWDIILTFPIPKFERNLELILILNDLKNKIQLLIRDQKWTVFLIFIKKILERNNFPKIFLFCIFIQGNFISKTICIIAYFQNIYLLIVAFLKQIYFQIS